MTDQKEIIILRPYTDNGHFLVPFDLGEKFNDPRFEHTGKNDQVHKGNVKVIDFPDSFNGDIRYHAIAQCVMHNCPHTFLLIAQSEE